MRAGVATEPAMDRAFVDERHECGIRGPEPFVRPFSPPSCSLIYALRVDEDGNPNAQPNRSKQHFFSVSL